MACHSPVTGLRREGVGWRDTPEQFDHRILLHMGPGAFSPQGDQDHALLFRFVMIRLLLNLYNFDLCWAVAINDKSSASLPSTVQLWFYAALPVNRTGRQLLTVPHIPNSSVGRSIRFELSSAVLRVFTVWTQPLILKLRIQPICPTSDITTGAGSARKWYQGQISIQPTTITRVKILVLAFFSQKFSKRF